MWQHERLPSELFFALQGTFNFEQDSNNLRRIGAPVTVGVLTLHIASMMAALSLRHVRTKYITAASELARSAFIRSGAMRENFSEE